MAALPLSACPLKRLEIHGGSTCNTYDAANLESSLTATLEAQRSITGSHSNLLLQSHLGLRRVFSVQLTDLSMSPNSQRKSMKTHQPSLRICIQICRTEQTAIFDFERIQDFENIISTFKRIGFCVQDGIPLTLHTCTASQIDALSPHRFGPRLSSFTPLRNEGQQFSQSEFSFTAMLNSEIPLTQLLSPDTRDHAPLPHDGPQQSHLQTDLATAFAPHTNSQHYHLSQPKNMYRPRISSPLRYAIPMNNQSETPGLPMPSSQPIPHTDHADMASLPSHRCISAPGSLSDSLQFPKVSVTNDNASLDYQFSPTGSQDSTTSAGSCSQTREATDDDLNSQLGHDFRKHLPRTRSLPFLKDRDHKVVKLKPRNKQNQRLNNSHEKETSANNTNVFKEEKTKISKSNSINSQLMSHRTPPQPKASQVDGTLAYHSSLEVTKLSAMLITDPTMLERANKATAHLLDQYKEDVGRGHNAAFYAEFYLEQIHELRREFWFKELKRMDEFDSGSLYGT